MEARKMNEVGISTVAAAAPAQMNGQVLTMPSVKKNRKITRKDIADHIGMSLATVDQALDANEKYVSRVSYETRMKVINAADELGYVYFDKRKAIQLANHVFYHNGNYHTRKEEIDRMEQLRREGYTNAQIAEKTGRSHKHVLHVIGYQPEEYTAESKKLAGRIRVQRRKTRENVVVELAENERKRKLEADIATYRRESAKLNAERSSIEAQLAMHANAIRRSMEEQDRLNAQKQVNEQHMGELEPLRRAAMKAAEQLGVAI